MNEMHFYWKLWETRIKMTETSFKELSQQGGFVGPFTRVSIALDNIKSVVATILEDEIDFADR